MKQLTTVLSATALTASGSAAQIVDLPDDAKQLTCFIIVSAVSGTTPSATFTVQFSPDRTNWADAASGSAITAAGNQRIAVAANVGPYCRISYAITGTTPSFTTTIYTDARG